MRIIHHITLLATAALLALAVPTAGAALSKKAYFDVKISAFQSVSWTEDLTARDCGGGVATLTGNGSSVLRTFSAGHPWLIARRLPNASLASLQFAGRPGGTNAVGSFHREGQAQATSTSQGSNPSCGQPIPAEPDCGTVKVPTGAQLYLSYDAPGMWPYHSVPAPLVPSLVLTGPYSSGWTAPPFSFCPGINGDDWLGGTLSDGTDPIYSGPAGLPLKTLFGKSSHFTVSWSTKRVVDEARTMPGILGGKKPVTTSIHWKVRFTRRSGPPPIGAAGV